MFFLKNYKYTKTETNIQIKNEELTGKYSTFTSDRINLYFLFNINDFLKQINKYFTDKYFSYLNPLLLKNVINVI